MHNLFYYFEHFVCSFLTFHCYFTAARKLQEMRIMATDEVNSHRNTCVQSCAQKYQTSVISTISSSASANENENGHTNDLVSNFENDIIPKQHMTSTVVENYCKNENSNNNVISIKGTINLGYIADAMQPDTSLQRIGHAGDDSENIETNEKNNDNKPNLKTFLPKFIRIVKSPVYVFLCLAVTFTFMVISSMAVFVPKIIQNQYSHSAAVAGILSGKLLIFFIEDLT